MSIESIIFYLFSALALMSSISVILSKNPVRAVLSLVLTFFSVAVIWMLLRAEFLSVTLVLVYVGAIMVLFLFVVMMLDVELTSIREGFTRYFVIGTLVSTIFAAVLMMPALKTQGSFIHEGPSQAALHQDQAGQISNIKTLGLILYTDYLYALEIAGIILFVAMIAAIALTFRGSRGNKSIDPKWQVRVTKEDRLRLVDLKSKGESP